MEDVVIIYHRQPNRNPEVSRYSKASYEKILLDPSTPEVGISGEFTARRFSKDDVKSKFDN